MLGRRAASAKAWRHEEGGAFEKMKSFVSAVWEGKVEATKDRWESGLYSGGQ